MVLFKTDKINNNNKKTFESRKTSIRTDEVVISIFEQSS